MIPKSLATTMEEANLHKKKRLAARSEMISLAKTLEAERDGHKAVGHALQYGLVPKAIDQVRRDVTHRVSSRRVMVELREVRCAGVCWSTAWCGTAAYARVGVQPTGCLQCVFAPIKSTYPTGVVEDGR